MELPGRILIVGLGTSGCAVARYLGGLGRDITITDQKREEELAPALSRLDGVSFKGHFGGHRREDFLTHPLIVISPGVESDLPELMEARASGAEVVGEIELAARLVDEPIIAVTGTNGKTTTTALLGEVFRYAFGSVFVGGNIGNPLINYVMGDRKAPYLILEISSFQLETTKRFHAETALLLNITEDHLDRYRGFGEYEAAKLKVFENQTAGDFAVVNADLLGSVRTAARVLPFSTHLPVTEGAFAEGGRMIVRLGGTEHVYDRALSPLYGVHNTENILSVLLTAHLHGIGREAVEEALKGFYGFPHRVEFVRSREGVAFYNDSKATNVDATKRALQGIDQGVVLIAGGKDKGGSYRSILDFTGKLRALILIGEARERIRAELASAYTVYEEEDLEKAVKKAAEVAGQGDVVLFSPMCSSFDMFRDYKERGDTFRRIVEAL
jgi:UDP-N-acetylmuramoylalanine--D-glutamate ligase